MTANLVTINDPALRIHGRDASHELLAMHLHCTCTASAYMASTLDVLNESTEPPDAYPCASSPPYALLLCFGRKLNPSSLLPRNISLILTQSPANGLASNVSSSFRPR